MVGTKWYKCDLHLHTPASKCFQARETVTPEQWVQEAIDKGLTCVAVTDHNSAEWIELIQAEAKKKGLNIFPGVELTCSEAKVHILVLFEIEIIIYKKESMRTSLHFAELIVLNLANKMPILH